MSNNIVSTVETFGDVRRLILETIMGIRDGSLDVQQGIAMAAGFKVLNDNIQVEINAAKLSVLTEGRAHSFGSVVGMGRRMIGSSPIEIEGSAP